MVVLPAINCNEFECVRDRFERAASFFPAGTWLHVDVADGIFTYNKTWGDPEQLKAMQIQFPDFKPNIEVHLMVENPEEQIVLEHVPENDKPVDLCSNIAANDTPENYRVGVAYR